MLSLTIEPTGQARYDQRTVRMLIVPIRRDDNSQVRALGGMPCSDAFDPKRTSITSFQYVKLSLS